MTSIALLKGSVKHYDWGGYSFIPSLLQVENAGHQPYAEYWLGIHPLAECILEGTDGETIALTAYLDQHKEEVLGKDVLKKFDNLPYLLKILDVKDMLSIQVHPSKKAAEKEFARENAAGIPLNATNRNYKDDNHKPELMVALGDFWLLHGFKSSEKMGEMFAKTSELVSLAPVFSKQGYAALYSRVMEMSQGEVNKMLAPLLDRILPLYHDNKLEKSNEDFWAARAADTFQQGHAIDRGIFSIYFFNLLQLKKGEAIFQDAGIPHAYLEGQNVEIMANSDNVLRGGLTTKYIDVPELLKHIRFEATPYKILKGRARQHEKVYKTTAPDFELGGFELEKGEVVTFNTFTAEMLLLTEGHVEVAGGSGQVQLMNGQPSAIAFSNQEVQIKALEKSILFRATVPRPHA